MKVIRTLFLIVIMILLISACDITGLFKPGDPTATQQPPLPTNTPTTAPTNPEIQPTPTRTKPTDKPVTPTATLFPEYLTHFVTDESGAITANIPTVWTDQQTLPWLDEAGREVGIIFIASTNIDKFLVLEAEGVAISVSSQYPLGFIQLLDAEVIPYLATCDDTYHTRWDFNTEIYRGKEAVFNCHGSNWEWLSIMTMVSKSNPAAYIARVIGFDMIPIFGGQFRDMLLQFEVNPENLP